MIIRPDAPAGQPVNTNAIDIHERRQPRNYRKAATKTDERTNVPLKAVEAAKPAGAPGDQPPDGLAPSTIAETPAVDVVDVPIGQVDSSDYALILGWAWHPQMPNESIDIEILDNDVTMLKLRADEFRSDLLSAHVGNGCHGFRVEGLGTSLSPGTHEVRVRRADDHRDLPGSPMSIAGFEPAVRDDEGSTESESTDNDPELLNLQQDATVRVTQSVAVPSAVAQALATVDPRTGTEPVGNIDRIDHGEISGWAWDPTRPDQPVEVEILDDAVVVLKVAADKPRPDLAKICGKNGCHGFSIKPHRSFPVVTTSRACATCQRWPGFAKLPNLDQPTWTGRSGRGLHG